MRKYTLVLATVCFVLASLLLQASAAPVPAVTSTPRPIKECHVCDEGLPLESTPTPQPAAHFWFFYDSGCPPCIKTLNEVLPPILSGYQAGQVVVHAWDMAQKGHELRLALEAQYGRAAQEIPVVFIGDHMLAGDQEIQQDLARLIDQYRARGGVALPQITTPVELLPTATPAAAAQLASSTAAKQPPSDKVIIYFFWGDGCPHCAAEKPFLERLGQQDSIEVRAFEVWSSPQNRDLFYKVAASLGFEPRAVPTTIIGERYWVGYNDQIGREIEAAVTACAARAAGCRDAGQGIAPAKSPLATPTSTPRPVVRAVLFWMDGCPHCHEVINQVLPPLQQKYGDKLNIHLIEVKSQQDVDQLYQLGAALNVPKQNVGVPFLVIGDKVLVGSAQILGELPGLIEKHMAAGGVDYPNLPGLAELLPTTAPRPATAQPPGTVTPTPATVALSSAPAQPQAPAPEKHWIDLPVLGQVDLDRYSLAVSTAIIGVVDGINPCSLWVISLLLALVINTGSRKKMLAVGLTYLLVAAGLYGLIILGLFSVFAFVGYALWIRIAVALVALIMAAVNIKDYFWFKEGVSLTISDEHKPGIYRDIRNILSPGKSGLALVGATAAMAGGVTLIEMPCTAGLPILWTKLIAAHNVSALEFGLLLGLYLLLFMIDELAVFLSAVITLRASRLEEKEGRMLKLVGGMVMLVLAVVLLVDPTLMDSLRNSLMVFGAALGVSVLVLVVHRKVLPRLGIVIGTENLGGEPRRKAAERE